jgi:hypothetical protein
MASDSLPTLPPQATGTLFILLVSKFLGNPTHNPPDAAQFNAGKLQSSNSALPQGGNTNPYLSEISEHSFVDPGSRLRLMRVLS